MIVRRDMVPSVFSDLPVLDCHVHTWMLGEIIDRENLQRQEKELVEAVKGGGLKGMYAFDSSTHAPLYLKARYPGLFYAGGYAPWTGDTDRLPDVDWPSYISSLIKLGYDGIGEMGSKPVTRDRHVPLDSSYYEGFWDSCEALGYPVLCHVGDVEDFWHENLTPDWAKVRGWGYWDGDYPSLSILYGEIENVLDSHPSLKIALCHFLFLSPHIDEAITFLRNHKNANIDLSLGVELMFNISRRRDDWRDFFIRYDDRILFGTDIGMSTTLQQHKDRIWLIRNFLESKEEFHTPDTADDLLTRYEEPYLGLNLPRTSLEKIYYKNFKRLWKRQPTDVNVEAAITTCEMEGNAIMANAFKTLPPDRNPLVELKMMEFEGEFDRS